MLTQDQVTLLEKSIVRILYFQEKNIINRKEWGNINFEIIGANIEEIFTQLTILKDLPLNKISVNVFGKLIGGLEQISSSMGRLDNFNLKAGYGQPYAVVRDKLAKEFAAAAGSIIDTLNVQLGHLRNEREDLEKLKKEINKFKQNVTKEQKSAIAKLKEDEATAKSILESMKDAASTTGVTAFSKSFHDESKDLDTIAKYWLIAAIALALSTIVVVSIFFYTVSWTYSNSIPVAIQYVSLRIIVLAILFTATLWCGRIYKTLKHQSSVNRHRALSLSTFEAFTKAAGEDIQTKHAVLLEATRAIFSAQNTGFLDSKDSQYSSPNTQIIEMAKSMGIGSN